jgi:drug/metabolite transporter (DMT)-like permease
MKNKALLGYGMILLSAFFFGSYGVWAKLIGTEFGIFFQGWVRSALVLVILISIAFTTKSFKVVLPSERKWIFICVLFGVFTQVPIYYAYTHMDIGTANLIFFAMVAITSYVIGMGFLKEKITLTKIIALILAFIGLIIIFGFSIATFSILAMLLAAINGIASGGEVATTKKSTQKFSSLQVGIYVWVGIFITHLPLSIFMREKQIIPTFDSAWIAMSLFALAGLLAFWLVIEGFKYVDASIGGLIGLSEILFSILFGVIFFQEKITNTIIIGGILILLAGMLPDVITIFSKRK